MRWGLAGPRSRGKRNRGARSIKDPNQNALTLGVQWIDEDHCKAVRFGMNAEVCKQGLMAVMEKCSNREKTGDGLL